MRHVVMHSTGGPEVLRIEEVPDLVPGPGEVLVRVEAAGVNYADTMRRRGVYLETTPVPFVLGAEIAGTVEGLGSGVSGFAKGDRVFAAVGVGGYAEHIRVPAAQLVPMPDGLSFDQAAALPVQGLTAALLLKDAGHLVSGETVLIHAAAGGVGLIASQLAKAYGADRVIGLASSHTKRELALSIGRADAVLDYTLDRWPDAVRGAAGGRGIDLVLASTGGDVLSSSLQSLAPFGRLIVFGDAGGDGLALDAGRLLTPNQAVIGFSFGGYLGRPELIAKRLGELVGMVLSGRLSLHIGATFPLAEASEAHRLLESRASMGKIILHPHEG